MGEVYLKLDLARPWTDARIVEPAAVRSTGSLTAARGHRAGVGDCKKHAERPQCSQSASIRPPADGQVRDSKSLRRESRQAGELSSVDRDNGCALK
jgi:hypothetical protein